MAVKIKYRDPKSTDFKTTDIVINASEGTLFYKTNKRDIYKVQGDNLNTVETEITPDNIIKGNLHISGALLPTTNEGFDLGSAEKIWHTLHVKDDSIKMYKDGVEVGKIQFESGSGLKIKDKEGNTRGIIGNVDGGSF
tara:strand:+ start:3258 stop:3671 length:414 start_codon:yes stop_codon:yes gene_type:complete